MILTDEQKGLLAEFPKMFFTTDQVEKALEVPWGTVVSAYLAGELANLPQAREIHRMLVLEHGSAGVTLLRILAVLEKIEANQPALVQEE